MQTALRQDPIQNLAEYVAESVENEEDFHFLRFESLQRLNIVSLQIELARLKSKFQYQHQGSSEDLNELDFKLQQYPTAIRDYQYLQDKKKKTSKKTEQLDRKLRLHKYFYSAAELTYPWESHYSYFQDEQHHRSTPVDPLRQTLMRHLPSRLTFSHSERQAREKEYSEGLASRHVSGFIDRLARFIIAITGGIFLVVPMIIMTAATLRDEEPGHGVRWRRHIRPNPLLRHPGVQCRDAGLNCHICCRVGCFGWYEWRRFGQ